MGCLNHHFEIASTPLLSPAANTLEDCIQICKDHATCDHFSYDANGKLCKLIQGQQNQVYRGNHTSGPIVCPTPSPSTTAQSLSNQNSTVHPFFHYSH